MHICCCLRCPWCRCRRDLLPPIARSRTLPSACPAPKAAAITLPSPGMSCVQELNNEVLAENRGQPVIEDLYYFTSVKVRLGEGIHSRAA